MAALPDELIDTVALCGPPDVVRERLRGLPRRRRRDADRHADGVDAGGPRCEQLRLVARARCEPPRALLLRRLRRPGPRVPDARARARAARARPRGDAADVARWQRGRRARAAWRSRRRRSTRCSPRRERPLKPYEAAVRAHARDRAARARRSRRTSWSPTSSRSRPRSPPSSRACRSRRSSRTSIPRSRPAARRTRSARGCRARASAARCGGATRPLVERGLRARARRAERTRARGSGCRRCRASTAAISRGARAGRDVPAARVPARAGRRGRRSSGRCCGSRRSSDVEPPPGDGPLVLVAPSTSQDPEHRAAARRAGRARATCPSACSPRTNRRAAARAARRPGERACSSTWLSYARTMPRCDVVVCHGGHGTVARALASGCVVVVVPAAGDMAENAARVDWAGVGVRVPRRMCTPRAIGLAVGRALAKPGLRRVRGRCPPGPRRTMRRCAPPGWWSGSREADGEGAGLPGPGSGGPGNLAR